MLQFPKDEWWFCEDPSCAKPDRAYGLEARFLAHLWLQQVRKDPVRVHVLMDFVRSSVSIPTFRVGEGNLAARVEQLLISGRLHFHRKTVIKSGSAVEREAPPFPLANRQPRVASKAPAPVDAPSFASDTNFSSQAAVLAAASASGMPFCLECLKNS